LLPKPTAGDQVYGTLVLQFGDAKTLKGTREISEATAALLDHGTQSLTRQAIEDQFTELHANVGFSGSAGNVVVRLSTQGKYLPKVLDLVLQILKEASFPAPELAQYQAQAVSALRNAMSEPAALASRALARHDNPWPADDPRYTPTFDEALNDVQSLTAEQLRAFHQKFYGAGSLSFSAVGTFDADAVREHLTQGLAGWKAAPAYTRLSDPYHQVPAETFTINTPDKANAFYLASMPLHIQDTNPDFTALYVANYLLGESQSSRLWNRVRETDGLSYTVGSSLDISSYEPSGSWSLYAIHAPENSQRLKKAINEEIARALKDGFTDTEVEQATTAILNFRRLARARDEVLSSSWINYLQLGRTFAWSAKMDAELEHLTAEKVNQALRTWFKPENLSVALAADQAKQAKN
jgi:zinc protease